MCVKRPCYDPLSSQSQPSVPSARHAGSRSSFDDAPPWSSLVVSFLAGTNSTLVSNLPHALPSAAELDTLFTFVAYCVDPLLDGGRMDVLLPSQFIADFSRSSGGAAVPPFIASAVYATHCICRINCLCAVSFTRYAHCVVDPAPSLTVHLAASGQAVFSTLAREFSTALPACVDLSLCRALATLHLSLLRSEVDNARGVVQLSVVSSTGQRPTYLPPVHHRIYKLFSHPLRRGVLANYLPFQLSPNYPF